MKTIPVLLGVATVAALLGASPVQAEPAPRRVALLAPRAVAFTAPRPLEHAPLPRAPTPTDAVIVQSRVQGSGEDATGNCLSLCGASSADVVVQVATRQRLALVTRMWGNTLRAGETSITVGIAGAGLRVKMGPRAWIDAGAGVAHVSIDRDDNVDVVALTSVTPAALVAAGADLGDIGTLAFDVQVRAGSSMYAIGMPVRDALVALRMRW